MSAEDIKSRPLAAHAMTDAERLNYDDIFIRKRILLFAKSKIAHVFPNMSLDEFLNLPRQYMEFIVHTANEISTKEAQSENTHAEKILKELGLSATKNQGGKS